jgi:glycosyltransferase involved in cell wall biosynthesis
LNVPMTRECRFPGTALVSCHPLSSGHGHVASALHRLDLLESLWLFKIRGRDIEDGFNRVVAPRLNPGGAAVLASAWLGSAWQRAVRSVRWAHLTSPHFFHLARFTPNLTGIVHDLEYLEPPGRSRSPPGYRFLMSREMRWASRLKGVVTVTETTRRRLLEVNPDLRPTTIHLWTGDEFRYRTRLEARRTLHLPEESKLILSVGLDLPRKNLDVLPPLLERLGSRYALVRIGGCRRLEGRFPPGRLLSFPYVSPSEYPLFFNAADALVYPSLAEGFGVPLIEATNSSTPVVASEIPVFREVLGGDAHLVPPADLDRWVEATRAAADTSEDQRAAGQLLPSLGDHYRPARALEEYSAFFRSAGLA